MHAEVKQLTALLKKDLESSTPLNKIFLPSLESLFALRLKALKWLAENEDLNIADAVKDIYDELLNANYSKGLSTLADNCLFALRVQMKFIEQLSTKVGSISPESITAEFKAIPEITYMQFITSMSALVPDDEGLQTFLDWLNDSLKMEYGLIALHFLVHDKWNISSSKQRELTFMVADAAQEFSALSTLLFFGHQSKEVIAESHQYLSAAFVNEQLSLAEEGITEYEKSISQHEGKVSKRRSSKR